MKGLWRALDRDEGDLVRRALTHPACWPPDPDERQALAAKLRQPFPEGEVGVALVVTASGPRGSLFALERAAPGPGVVELGAAARAAVETARRVITRDAAAMIRPRLLRSGRSWRARRLARVGEGRDAYIEGSSLGVSAALALLSELARRPVPADLVASATIDRDGNLGPVEGLEVKLEVVASWGLGVRRFLVAQEQVEELRQIVAERGARIEVCGARDVSQVLEVAFPKLFDELRDRLRDHPQEAESVSRALYSLALDGSRSLQDWGSFAKTAALVAEVAGDERARRRASIAAAIAARHCGHSCPLPVDDAWLARERRPRRLALLAHGVQAATDAAKDLPEFEATARAALAPDRERSEGDLRLLGALGRYHAAWHRFDQALQDLEAVTEAWLELDFVTEACFPACELLRVLGACGDGRRFDAFRASTLPFFEGDPRLGAVDQAFLALALVRALVQLGRPQEALAQSTDAGADWAAAPSHVEASGERWRALALEALGRDAEAARARERVRRIAQRSPRDAGFCAVLVDLDAALHGRCMLDAERAIERLREDPEERREVERIAELSEGTPLPVAVARYWRY